MTGLQPTTDRILEIGAIVTDWDFTELENLESGVGQNPQEITSLMNNEFYKKFPQNRQQLLELSAKSPDEKTVEAQVLELVNRHFAADEPVLLAGNSIHMDRLFIRQWWPSLEARLHYRMLDVSAWKVLMQAKYQVGFDKSEAHRALGDIRESIAELQYYLQWFGAGRD
jgi:oligoribonuclease